MNNDIENRLEALENAHRALSAQHIAMIEIFKIIAPIINLNQKQLNPRLTIAYDTISELMQDDGFDEPFQHEVMRYFDVLSSRLLANTHPYPTSHDE